MSRIKIAKSPRRPGGGRSISRATLAAIRLHEHNQERRADRNAIAAPPLMAPLSLSKLAAGAADAWCWFHEPRALAVGGKTFFGTTGSDGNSVSTGRTTLYEIDEATGVITSKVMQSSTIAAWWADDHDYPTIVVRPDGRLIAFYAPHRVAAPIYFRISVGVGTMAQGWSQEYNLGNTAAQPTYPSPVILSGEGNKLYLFYRNGTSSGPLSYVTSADIATVAPPTVDGGTIGATPTWTAEKRLAQSTGTQGIYHKVTSNNVDRIDILCTDAVGAQAGAKTDVRHVYWQNGQWRGSNGTALGDGSTMIGFTGFTPVATSGAPDNLGDMWVSHVQRRASGVVEGVFWRFVSTQDHRCYYARWDGVSWTKREVDAGFGMGLPDTRSTQITDGQGAAEGYYSPGAFFDTTEEGVLYISVGTASYSQLYRYQTKDKGLSWTRARVSDLAGENVRPVVPVNRSAKYSVLWLSGAYHYYDFSTNPAASDIGYTTKIQGASRSYVAPGALPTVVSQPVIAGSSVAAGNVLTASVGSWTGDTPMKFAYQWAKNGVDIAGATSSTYTVLAGDVGADITVRVTTTNYLGPVSAISAVAAKVATNLVTKSNSFDQWAGASATVSANVAAEPATGTVTADRMLEQAQTLAHSLTSANIAFVAGTAYTFAISARFESAQFIQLLFGGAAFGSLAYANFDIQNGVKATVGSAATANIVSLGNGWYRISVTATATGSTSTPVAIFGANSGTMTRAASYAGLVSNTRLLANAQVETGTGANPYNPNP
ncbi:BNR-4 repeat-containing protein [Bradyrhizobium sp. th.b2]|uniref:phage head spike fiber domain-containing protein n=1 Tax=Bradyrhizobium sp. th-b2 TaxID=172088 RepID=UPI000687AE4F|nr:BNR-4 repeat-containing protein [Bradyrhizobium sp. th.b2]